MKQPFFRFSFVFLSLLLSSSPARAQSDLLELSLEELMDIEVYSASKKQERLIDTAAAIHVISSEDIRRSGVTSIAEALRMAPGVSVLKSDSNSWDISARGFNGSIFANKLLVLIDGRSVYTPFFAGVLWDVQDTVLEDIDRIEVIRGSGGTLWGANAVNGVINIITKRPKDTQGTLVVAGGGSEEKAFSTLRYGSSAKGWDYRGYGKYFDRDNGYRKNAGFSVDGWDMGQTGFRAEKERWNIQGDYYQGHIGQRSSATYFTAPFSRITEETSDVEGGNLLARYSEENWTFQMYWDTTYRSSKTYIERRDKFDLEFSNRISLTESQALNWGGGYRLELERAHETESIRITEPGDPDQVFNLFVQDEISVTEKLKIIFGSKFEHNIYTQLEVQPNLRFSYSLDDSSLIWGAVSRAVRTPSRLESDAWITSLSSSAPVFSRATGSHRLSAEDMLSFELGYRNQVNPQTYFDVATFFNTYNDLITFNLGNVIIDRGYPVVLIPTVNGMEGEVYGIELSGEVRVTDWWKIESAYAFTKMALSSYLTQHVLATTFERLLEDAVPRHNFYSRSSFDLPAGFELDAALRYMDSINDGTIPSVIEVDLNLSKKIKDWTFSLVGQNLIEHHHKESGAANSTQIERGGYAKVTWEF